MTIPPQLSALIDQVNEELNQLEQEVQQQLARVRSLLNSFPDNIFFIELFGELNNFQFFRTIRERRVENLVNRILPDDTSSSMTQETGEELATFLGEILEARFRAANIKRIVDQLL